MTRPLTILGLAALCLAVIVQPAATEPHHVWEVLTSDPARVVRATTVDYSDVDTSSVTGLHVLLSRLEEAADAVCGRANFVESNVERQDYNQCRETAIAHAVAATGLPGLSFLSAGRHAAQEAAKQAKAADPEQRSSAQ